MTQVILPRSSAVLTSAAPVSLTINGRKVTARLGQSVLEAANDAGIDIPTLCHHPVLSSHGGCRLCVVEIEKQRGLQPSCTFPVVDGLVIQTESPRIVAARKFAIEMLFSERLHYCMYCPASGGEHSSDCQLQQLAYRYGLDCWPYAPCADVRWPIDATRIHFVMDHSRCILCRRCVRACAELAASHTLGVQQRGARTMICADDGVPFGESSCVSCGTCLQVCPTGALMDRRSAFMGHDSDTQRTRCTCLACSVGCSIETVVRDGKLLRIEGVWDTPNRGVLCVKGRFEVLDDPPPRLLRPMVRRNGGHVECSWDEALTVVAERLRQASSIAGLVTARSTNQALVAFTRMFHDVFRSDQMSLIRGRVPPLNIGQTVGMAELLAADCVVILGGDPMDNQMVLAYQIRRAVDRGSRLVVVDSEETELERLADVVIRFQEEPFTAAQPHARISHLRPDRLAQVKTAIDSAERPVILYGPQLDDELYTALRMLPGRTRFIPLVDGANAVGAALQGLRVAPVQGEALYVIASDEMPHEMPLPEARFTVVQASYQSHWTAGADVILPSKIWYEKTGHITSFDGRRLAMTRSVDAPADVLNDWTTLFMLSVKMAQPLNCITVAESFAGA